MFDMCYDIFSKGEDGVKGEKGTSGDRVSNVTELANRVNFGEGEKPFFSLEQRSEGRNCPNTCGFLDSLSILPVWDSEGVFG